MGRNWTPSQPRDRHNALLWARDVVRGKNWCTLDTETTGCDVDDQVVEIAVCNPQTLETRAWRVRPTCPISDGARAIHDIRDEDLVNAPTYAEIWPTIEAHILTITPAKFTIFYNAEFDIARLRASARGQTPKMKPPAIWTNQCAMTRYAAVHGEEKWNGYRWQKLEVACQTLGIEVDGTLHTSAVDARLTAQLVLKMAEMAEQEVPASLIAAHDAGRAKMREIRQQQRGA